MYLAELLEETLAGRLVDADPRLTVPLLCLHHRLALCKLVGTGVCIGLQLLQRTSLHDCLSSLRQQFPALRMVAVMEPVVVAVRE